MDEPSYEGEERSVCFSIFFFSSRRRHTRYIGDWSSDVCSSDLRAEAETRHPRGPGHAGRWSGGSDQRAGPRGRPGRRKDGPTLRGVLHDQTPRHGHGLGDLPLDHRCPWGPVVGGVQSGAGRDLLLQTPRRRSIVTEASTVFVVDDDPSVRRSTERLIRSMGFAARTFASAKEFLHNTRVEGPACLVLDVRLPGLSGLDLQRELTQSGVQIPIIFITGHGSIPMSVGAMKAGAVEFLTKPVRPRDLLAAIRAAIERDRASHRARLEAGALRERYERLTPREREVLAHVVAGLPNKQIAGELATTERTIKFHRAHIMEKMEAASLAELVQMGGQLGISPPESRAGPVPKDS